MRRIKHLIKDLPFVMMIANLIGWLFSFTQWFEDFNWFNTQLFGTSLFAVLFMAFHAYVHRYCLYSWIAIIGLGLLNVVNIFYYFFDFPYKQIYIGIILLSSLVMFFVIFTKKQYLKHEPHIENN
jgi:hypothetical protein